MTTSERDLTPADFGGSNGAPHAAGASPESDGRQAATAHPLAGAAGRLDDALVDRLARSLFEGLPSMELPQGIPSALGARPAGIPPVRPDPASTGTVPLGAGLPPSSAPAPASIFAPMDLFGALPPLLGPPPAAAPLAVAAPGASPFYFLPATPAPTPEVVSPVVGRTGFDVLHVRRDFPILAERIHGHPLAWLDNAATTHKPRAVLDRLVHYYEHEYSNVHRAAHTLAARSTEAYEQAREKLRRFLGASSSKEIVFVRGTTEAVNLVANTWGRVNVGRGDEIVLTTMEHHSNIVPWQFLASAVGAHIRVVPITDRGEIMLGEYGRLLGPRTRLVAMTHVSNALGTVTPVREMIQMARRFDARVLVDGAQAVSHFPVNVQELDADFYVLSGHKMFGPSGVGVLYGKKALLDEMPPWQGGGNMIERVTFEHSTFADAPARFEAGTATLGPAVGLGAAVDYLERLGMTNVARHEHELMAHATEALRCIPGLRLIGTAPEKAGVVSFLLDGHEPVSVGKALDQEGIAVRAGHHCAQPTMDRFGVAATVRPSFALYNTHEEIERLARALRRLATR